MSDAEDKSLELALSILVAANPRIARQDGVVGYSAVTDLDRMTELERMVARLFLKTSSDASTLRDAHKRNAALLSEVNVLTAKLDFRSQQQRVHRRVEAEVSEDNRVVPSVAIGEPIGISCDGCAPCNRMRTYQPSSDPSIEHPAASGQDTYDVTDIPMAHLLWERAVLLREAGMCIYKTSGRTKLICTRHQFCSLLDSRGGDSVARLLTSWKK